MNKFFTILILLYVYVNQGNALGKEEFVIIPDTSIQRNDSETEVPVKIDERISVTVSSEGGISLKFSNYEDYWYFGEYIQDVPEDTDQHELLGLMAPRPFLLIGGDQYDTEKSWYYINAAQEVYNLYGEEEKIGYFNHHSGHSPSPHAVNLAFEWLNHFLNDTE